MSKINFISDINNLMEPSYTLQFKIFVDNLLQVIYQNVYNTNYDHVMIDVGANKGVITEILLRHIDTTSGKVIAIDAHPRWLEQFKFANHPQVETHNLGCYSYDCEKKFISENELTGLGYFGLSPDKTQINVSKLKSTLISCKTLDSIVDTASKITFIKIDAESSDFEVLLGSKNILMKHRPFVVFEFSGQTLEKAHGHSRNDFFDFFKSVNYNLYSLGQGKTEDYVAKHWDSFNFQCQDILAMPAEYNHLASNNNYILETT